MKKQEVEGIKTIPLIVLGWRFLIEIFVIDTKIQNNFRMSTNNLILKILQEN